MLNSASAPKALSGPQKALHKLGLERPIDLALHLPLRYEDETCLVKLADAQSGQVVQVEGVVRHSEIKLGSTRQLLVTLDDGSNTCLLRFFSFYPAQQKALAVGNRIRVRGEIRTGFGGPSMMHPSYKSADGALATTLTPVYPTVAGLPQHYLRKAIAAALEQADLSDTIAPAYLKPIGLETKWSLKTALLFLHHPSPKTKIEQLQDKNHPAWQRLKAEELLAQQLSQWQAKRERSKLQAPVLAGKSNHDHNCTESLPQRLLAALPFALTAAQRRVSQEIAHDLGQGIPMQRLLQGDVGCGKTVVAALAAALCIDASWQCALMAPTEILASQHFVKLVGWLVPLGVRVAWLTGQQKPKERRHMLALIASGEAQLVVGTHAMIQNKVQFARLALVIIDEQHRFGVAQRLALRSKLALQLEPHLLMMSATPIPRTLAMSYYADLSLSTIDELPPGRTPVVTKLIHASRRDEVVLRIGAQIAQGRQVYWICPLIEESEALDLVNASQTHADLSAALPQTTVGLLHSRLPPAQKQAVMQSFVKGEIAVLVSTTVIEVGVDVPNASLMVIEHAERFGLSQLHQLRGRVGRGTQASTCVLLYSTGEAPRLGETARQRLRAMLESSDGFEIARRDLDIRGPGEFMGARQSGSALLRFANPALDAELLAWAQATAPIMLAQEPAMAQLHMQRWLGARAEFLSA